MQENRNAFLTISYRQVVFITFLTSSMVRNSRSATNFCGFSLASSNVNGLCSISPSRTALASAEPKRFTKMRQVVQLNVFFPSLKVQVFKNAMKPLQNSLSTSFKNGSDFPIWDRYCSTRACTFLLEHLDDSESSALSSTYYPNHALSVRLDFFTFSQSTSPSF